MTFVLALGIVATIIIGLIKLRYDHYRIAKYVKIEKKEQTTPTPQMLEAARVEEKEDIPFGIRAIESGIEVEGVWISKSNTPAGSTASSLNEVRLDLSQLASAIEPPRPAYATSSRSSSSNFERAVSAERLPSDSRSSSPGRTNDSQPRSFTATRYSTNIVRNSTALNALEGLDISTMPTLRYEHVALGQEQTSPSNSSGSSGETSDESDYMQIPLQDRPYEPAYLKPVNDHLSIPVPADPRTDLHLLQSHRLSHVAETGQLTPRVRRPGVSGEWASGADNVRSADEISTANNGVSYFVPRQKTPSPPLDAVVYSTDDVPADIGIAFTNNAVSQPRKSKRTPSPPEIYMPQSYQPRGPQHIYEVEETPERYAVPTHQNQRESHVLRKVNSGFEILRPGTFPAPSAEEIAEEKRQSRRLQKKRRPSQGSGTSSRPGE